MSGDLRNGTMEMMNFNEAGNMLGLTLHPIYLMHNSYCQTILMKTIVSTHDSQSDTAELSV